MIIKSAILCQDLRMEVRLAYNTRPCLWFECIWMWKILFISFAKFDSRLHIWKAIRIRLKVKVSLSLTCQCSWWQHIHSGGPWPLPVQNFYVHWTRQLFVLEKNWQHFLHKTFGIKHFKPKLLQIKDEFIYLKHFF